jgi:type II secretory pathway pseudopilin PulG
MIRFTPQFLGKKHLEKGFTYAEIIVIMGIVTMLFGFATVNLVKVQRSSSVNATVQTLLTDIKQQQLKAMVGATEGRTASDSYGIYLESNRYSFFHGSVYAPSDTSNFPVKLDSSITISTTFPNNSLIFSRRSGEVTGFVPGQNTITVRNNTGTEQKIITINRYGVITGND